MNEAGMVMTFGGFGVSVVVWLMSWKSQQGKELFALRKLAEDTHTLVNSNMGVQLKLGMELLEFKAVTTGKDEHIQAAKLAKMKYEEHVKKQGVVDMGAVTPLGKTA